MQSRPYLFSCGVVLLIVRWHTEWHTDQLADGRIIMGWARASSATRAVHCMFTVTGLMAFGMLLGTFLSFPTFALMAVACSVIYSFYYFDGTVIGYIIDLLEAIIALQIGYFITVVAIVLRRRLQLGHRNDQ